MESPAPAPLSGGSPASARTPTQGGWVRSSWEEFWVPGPEQGAQGVLQAPPWGQGAETRSQPSMCPRRRPAEAPALLRVSVC